MNIKFILRAKGYDVYTIGQDASVGESIRKLAELKIGALAVLDKEGRLSGIISERDVLTVSAENSGNVWNMPVRKVMTPRENIIAAALDDSVETTMSKMTEQRIRHLPVLQDERVIGIVSIGDVVKALLELTREENVHMREYILGRPVPV